MFDLRLWAFCYALYWGYTNIASVEDTEQVQQIIEVIQETGKCDEWCQQEKDT
jgi:hypothetical protein